jgi:hypothetical protein
LFGLGLSLGRLGLLFSLGLLLGIGHLLGLGMVLLFLSLGLGLELLLLLGPGLSQFVSVFAVFFRTVFFRRQAHDAHRILTKKGETRT